MFKLYALFYNILIYNLINRYYMYSYLRICSYNYIGLAPQNSGSFCGAGIIDYQKSNVLNN